MVVRLRSKQENVRTDDSIGYRGDDVVRVVRGDETGEGRRRGAATDSRSERESADGLAAHHYASERGDRDDHVSVYGETFGPRETQQGPLCGIEKRVGKS